MKSFRLDTDSINDAIESLPAIFAAVVLSGVLAYLGWFDVIWRDIMVVFGGIYFGYVMRATFTQNMRSKYPNAFYISLVSIGFCAATVGVLARMLFPTLQSGLVDYVWLSISFSTILAFGVPINASDPLCFWGGS